MSKPPAWTIEKCSEEFDSLARRTYELAERIDVSPQDVACMQFEIVIMLCLLVEHFVEAKRG